MDIRSKTDQLAIMVEVESPSFEAGQQKIDTEEIANSSEMKSTQRNQTFHNQHRDDDLTNMDNSNAIYGFKAYIKANGIQDPNLRIEKLQEI